MQNKKSAVIRFDALRKKSLINAFEPREISNADEAVEIGAKMAKAVAKKLKLDLRINEESSR